MSVRFRPMQSRLAMTVGVLLLGLLVGVGVAIASSPSSIGAARIRSGGLVQPTPTPLDVSPTPSVTSPGVLGAGARIAASGSNTLVASGASRTLTSGDGGKSWTPVTPAAGGVGLIVDPANPKTAIAGGASIQFTTDGGATWNRPLSRPPGPAPYQPLATSLDGKTWFFAHGGRLLRTRDGSASWVDSQGLPTLTNPVLVPGQNANQWFLAVANRVFELLENGDQANELPQASGNITDIAIVDSSRRILVVHSTTGDFVLNGTTWAIAGGGLTGPIAAGGSGTIVVGNGGGALGSAGLVKYSADDGTTWTQATGLPRDQSVEALAGQLGSGTFYAYCYGGDLYSSTDSGHSWVLVSRGLRGTSG